MTNILFQFDQIRAFSDNIQIWQKRTEIGNFTSFLALSQSVEVMENGLPDSIAK